MSTANRLEAYTLWLALPDGHCRPVAEFLLETDPRGRHRRSGLRYLPAWLDAPEAFPLNPVHAPLQTEPREWLGPELPAVLDEVLPGQWERQLLRHAWNQSNTLRDPGDLHAVLSAPRSSFRLGAMEILPGNAQPPALNSPLSLSDLEALILDARAVEAEAFPEAAALKRLRQGSSAGGARPKALIQDGGQPWLAKFNRADDPFNHVRAEALCLNLAERAGLQIPAHRVMRIGELEALLLHRFDVNEAGGRYHMLSANALLKDPETQADLAHPRYDDLVELIRHHGAEPARDLKRLYAQMLFNEAINNRDDHLRNFSFLQGEGGLHLSPAYDLVPSEALGSWPVLGFGHQVSLPRPGSDKALAAARHFGLPPTEAREVNEALRHAFSDLPQALQNLDLSPKDQALFKRLFWTP
ncbi:serine/threonine-protein kinase HipA [Natronospira proteinivora]|uniref:Serine/threonine-protein kinase HipA n=1 Tax=Natronospira proteinivora TaxID=1807133 RepID=A0ABT1G9H9_9GAMM|nr:HipA domain-containing protein [Natronospira proteinivora]MCP1727906.1 serine/threonine-protein kinase HipA [Natronospira proteinivora]